MTPAAARIAGCGLVTALGAGVAANVRRIRAGETGLSRPSLFPTPIADRVWIGQVPPGTADGSEPSRTLALALAAVREALSDAGLGEADLADAALVVGTVSGANWEMEARYRADLAASGTMHPCLHIEPGPGRVTETLAARLGIGGPRITCGSACTSSANAALVGMELLRSGTRRVLVLGFDVVGATILHGFDALMLLDPRGCRPFDANRAGITLGEGAAALVLEADRGEPDGRPRLLGGANRCDPHHMTASAPDGTGGEAVMREACRRAGVDPADLRAIKAHGTGTRDNDLTEGRALRRVFGEAVPPFASMKPYFGHPMGAAGAIEIVAYLACVGAGFAPAEPGFETPDPDLDLSPLTAHREAGPGLYLLNWFGFGGNSTSIVARVPAPGGAA